MSAASLLPRFTGTCGAARVITRSWHIVRAQASRGRNKPRSFFLLSLEDITSIFKIYARFQSRFDTDNAQFEQWLAKLKRLYLHAVCVCERERRVSAKSRRVDRVEIRCCMNSSPPGLRLCGYRRYLSPTDLSPNHRAGVAVLCVYMHGMRSYFFVRWL